MPKSTRIATARNIDSLRMSSTAVWHRPQLIRFHDHDATASGLEALCDLLLTEPDASCQLLDERLQVEHDVPFPRADELALVVDDTDECLARLAVRLLPEPLTQPDG